MKNLKEAFGSRLKEIRKSKKITQESLAELLDLSQRQLIRIENGENFPSSETISKISLVLGVELASLFDFRWNDDAMYFQSGVYTKPSFKVVKTSESVSITPSSQFYDKDLFLQKIVKDTEYEAQLFNICKIYNKPITVDIFENKKRVSIKTFHPNNEIEEIMSSSDIKNIELYDYIVVKLKEISADSNKLNYVKLAMDALNTKESLDEFTHVLKGMGLILR